MRSPSIKKINWGRLPNKLRSSSIYKINWGRLPLGQFIGLEDGDSLYSYMNWVRNIIILFEIIGMFYINFCIYKAACLSLSEWVICCLLTRPPQSCEKLKPFRQQISRSKCPPIYQIFKAPKWNVYISTNFRKISSSTAPPVCLNSLAK